jgi:RNA polymerase sigma-70 factor (ECF subfamily)
VTIGDALTVARLAAEAAAGDEASFRALVEREHDAMLGLCYAITRHPDLAAEAAQATWINAWRRLHTLRDATRIHAWLCAIAANEARAQLRRRRRAGVVPIEVLAEAPADGSDPGGRAGDIDLARAMSRLNPDDRALVALRYLGGLNASELSPALGMTASGTRARLQRILEQLRAELGDG